eukprot:TRINITY_DN27166_c0_g2_i1.p1 TRINITY_DN27166_c0_g2~~TRINITY_DN27166_c0_g2_i1.p1  ORF type:complete len:312 (+),score=63.61 TRINITY_DN27166_c0_g2_i1:41-937(+)
MAAASALPPLEQQRQLAQLNLTLEEPAISLPPIKLSAAPPVLVLPPIGKSASAPTLSSGPKPLHPKIYSKRWTTEKKRYLHYHKERRWLTLKARQSCVDFAPEERRELRRCFDALAGKNGMLKLEQVEDLFISLGMANDQAEVATLVNKVDDLKARELDFEQFLELVFARKDPRYLKRFRDMMDGSLGSKNLDFQTVLSQYRRELFFDASGYRSVSTERQILACNVLKNFSELRRRRHKQSLPARDPEAEALGLSMTPPASNEPTFQAKGDVPVGGLKMVWRAVCTEHDLMSPMSPRK